MSEHIKHRSQHWRHSSANNTIPSAVPVKLTTMLCLNQSNDICVKTVLTVELEIAKHKISDGRKVMCPEQADTLSSPQQKEQNS